MEAKKCQIISALDLTALTRNPKTVEVFLKAKGQLISKAIYVQLTSPKKRTEKFALFAFLLSTANKSNSSVRFLEESMTHQSAFRFYLTFSKTGYF